MAKTKEETTVSKTNSKKANFLTGTGRRKTAVARVFLYTEKGDFTVNGQNIEEYFTDEFTKQSWVRPFHIIGVSHPNSQFGASIKVEGSGPSAQLDAIVHGLSRALAQVNEEYSILLRKQGMLTRDPRMVERKKYYLRKARKAPQYSKR
jgi:small subunit ribosomal protein S9